MTKCAASGGRGFDAEWIFNRLFVQFELSDKTNLSVLRKITCWQQIGMPQVMENDDYREGRRICFVLCSLAVMLSSRPRFLLFM